MKSRLIAVMDIDANSYRELADFEDTVMQRIGNLREQYNILWSDVSIKERRDSKKGKPDIKNMTFRRT